jgi:hypothetical protein
MMIDSLAFRMPIINLSCMYFMLTPA